MSTPSLITFLAIGILAGFVAGKLMKGNGFGLLGDLVVGIVGALLGGWVFGLLGIAAYSLVGSFVTALVGALLLLYLLRVLKKA